MSKEVKSKIYQLVDSIEDEYILQMVMEDVAYYASDKNITGELTKDQLKELVKVSIRQIRATQWIGTI